MLNFDFIEIRCSYKKTRTYYFAMKPCHFLKMFLTFRQLKPYVLIWFVLIKKRVVLINLNTPQGANIPLYHGQSKIHNRAAGNYCPLKVKG